MEYSLIKTYESAVAQAKSKARETGCAIGIHYDGPYFHIDYCFEHGTEIDVIFP